jgi:hypothetical protein
MPHWAWPRQYAGPQVIAKEFAMYKFVIEREIPGAGKMSMPEIQAVARRSVSVLAGLGVEIQWVESYITGNKIYCVYLASDAELIREHGRLTGIPVNSIAQVVKMIDPTVAMSPA